MDILSAYYTKKQIAVINGFLGIEGESQLAQAMQVLDSCAYQIIKVYRLGISNNDRKHSFAEVVKSADNLSKSLHEGYLIRALFAKDSPDAYADVLIDELRYQSFLKELTWLKSTALKHEADYKNLKIEKDRLTPSKLLASSIEKMLEIYKHHTAKKVTLESLRGGEPITHAEQYIHACLMPLKTKYNHLSFSKENIRTAMENWRDSKKLGNND